jgi:hypothetical protein
MYPACAFYSRQTTGAADSSDRMKRVLEIGQQRTARVLRLAAFGSPLDQASESGALVADDIEGAPHLRDG